MAQLLYVPTIPLECTPAELLASGFAPTKKAVGSSPTIGGDDGQADNSTPQDSNPNTEEELKRKMEKRLRKQEKKERKAEKAARKEAKRIERQWSASASGPRRNPRDERRYDDLASLHSGDERDRERRHRRSRSRSPRRRSSPDRDTHYSRRSTSPWRSQRRPRSPSPPVAQHDRGDYDLAAMGRERSRDRRRWDDNARREHPRSRHFSP